MPEDVKSCFRNPSMQAVTCFLFTKNLKEDYETVLEAVKSGIISEERLNEVVTYILATKASLKLHEKQKSHTLIPDESALDILRCKKHIDMAYQVSDKAITLVKDEQNLLPLSKDKYKKVLTIVLGDAISASGKPAVGDHQSDMMHHGLPMRFRPCLSPLQIRIICRMCR